MTTTEATAAMVYLASILPVPDYDEWKTDLARGVHRRRRYGVSRHWIYRGSDDANEVMLVLELPSLEHAKNLLSSYESGIREWMDEVGLEIYPTFFVGERTEELTYGPASDGDSAE
jgi:hypothetical protein